MARTSKFDSADLAVIAKMDAVMLKELTRADREDRALFTKFSKAMDKEIRARQKELAQARDAALKQAVKLMAEFGITRKELA